MLHAPNPKNVWFKLDLHRIKYHNTSINHMGTFDMIRIEIDLDRILKLIPFYNVKFTFEISQNKF